MKHPPVQAFHIAILCALDIERQAMTACLDDVYHLSYKAQHDPMIYILGRIGRHAVAITSLYMYGTSQSAAAAANIGRSFPNIRTCLMVGIGGGVPYFHGSDIRLGDVVVSVPQGGHNGILPYDCGKDVEGIGFQPSPFAERPPQSLLLAVEHLDAGPWPRITAAIDDLISRGVIDTSFRSPGRDTDVLFESDAIHISGSATRDECLFSCSSLPQRQRDARENDHPVVYHGLIASGNQVIKSASRSRELAMKHGILCFEMEAAGVAKSLKCLTIRGISDYSDSHKAKHWQKYAALVAACYAKELLLWVLPQSLESMAYEYPTSIHWLVPDFRPSQVFGLHEQKADLYDFLTNEDCREQYLLVNGPYGSGKSSLISHAVHAVRDTTSVVWLSAIHDTEWKSNIIELATHLEKPYDYDDIDNTLLELLYIIEQRAQKPWILVVDNAKNPQDIVSRLDLQNKISPVTHRRVVIAGEGDGTVPHSQFPVKLVQLEYLWGREGRLFLRESLADDSLYESDEQCNELIDIMGAAPTHLAQCTAYMLEEWIPVSKLIERIVSIDLGARYEAMGFLENGVPETVVKFHVLLLELITVDDTTIRLFLKCAVYVGTQGIPVGLNTTQQKDLNILINKLVRYNITKRTHDQTLKFSYIVHTILLTILYENKLAELYDYAVDNIIQSSPRPGKSRLIDAHRLAFHGLYLVDNFSISTEKKIRVLVHLQNLFVATDAYKEVIYITNRIREIYNVSNEESKLAFFCDTRDCALSMAIACYKTGKYDLAQHVLGLLTPHTKPTDAKFRKISQYLSRVNFSACHKDDNDHVHSDVEQYTPFNFPRVESSGSHTPGRAAKSSMLSRIVMGDEQLLNQETSLLRSIL